MSSIVTPVVIFYIYYVRIFVLDHSEPAAMTSDDFRVDSFEVKKSLDVKKNVANFQLGPFLSRP